jgi:RNA polymerase sigma-70 factor (ECF subfamily)
MESSNTEKHIKYEKLLSRIAQNDQLAFNEFYEIYYSVLYRYASFYVQDEDTRKDVISDVFVSIWHNRTNMDKVQNLDNYLFVSIKNRSFRYIKETNAEHHVQIKDISEWELVDKMEPEQVLINGELHHLIENGINDLPKRCRLIFTLIRGEKKTYKEVAAILSISEKTVHAQMCIAVKRLGNMIKRYM